MIHNSERENFLRTYKTNRCRKVGCTQRNCDDYHDEDDRRRPPSAYRSEWCQYKLKLTPCPYRDKCRCCHSKNEYNYHPDNYEIKFKHCKFANCKQGKYCYFKHTSCEEDKFKPKEASKPAPNRSVAIQNETPQTNYWTVNRPVSSNQSKVFMNSSLYDDDFPQQTELSSRVVKEEEYQQQKETHEELVLAEESNQVKEEEHQQQQKETHEELVEQIVKESNQIDTTGEFSVSDYHQNGYKLTVIIIDICGRYLRDNLKKRVEEKFSNLNDFYRVIIELVINNVINKNYFACFANIFSKLGQTGTIEYDDHVDCINNIDYSLSLILYEKVFGVGHKLVKALREPKDFLISHTIQIGIPQRRFSQDKLDDQKFDSFVGQICQHLVEIIPEKEAIIRREIQDACQRKVIENEREYVNKLRKQFFPEMCEILDSDDVQLLKNEFNVEKLDESNFLHMFVKLLNEWRNNRHRYEGNILLQRLLLDKLLTLDQTHSPPEPANVYVENSKFNHITAVLNDDILRQKYFFILITVGLDETETRPPPVRMLKSLASHGCWNLVLDFHHNSVKSKIYDSTKPAGREYRTLLLNQLFEYQENDVKKKQTNEYRLSRECMFVKCNGCAFSNPAVDRPTSIQAYFRTIENFLISVIYNSSRALNIFSLTLIGKQGQQHLADKNFQLESLLDVFVNVINDPNISEHKNSTVQMENHVISSLSRDETQTLFKTDLSTPSAKFKLICDVSESIVANECGKREHVKIDKNFYVIPCNNDRKQSEISQERINKFKEKNIDIYHFDLGKIDDLDKHPQRMNIINNVKFDFLKSHSISPQALWIHEHVTPKNSHNTMYIRRKEADLLIDDFRNKRDLWNSLNVVRIEHKRSSGGTTLSRYVLYQLRKDFICMEVHKPSYEIIGDLQALKEDYRKEMILLVSQEALQQVNWSEHDLLQFQSTLRNTVFGCKIIYVSRNERINESKYNSKKMLLQLSTTLDSAESAAMKSLIDYKNAQKSNKKIHFYPLRFFMNDFDKIESIINSSMEILKCENGQDADLFKCECKNCREKLVLFLISSIEKYSMSGNLNKACISMILNRRIDFIDDVFLYGIENCNEIRALPELILLENHSFKLAHSCLIDHILARIKSLVGPDCDLLQVFCQQLINLGVKLKRSWEQVFKENFKNLLVEILFKNKNNNTMDGAAAPRRINYYTILVEELKANGNLKYLLEFLNEMAKLYEKNESYGHFIGLRAKIIFHLVETDKSKRSVRNRLEKQAIKLMECTLKNFELNQQDPDLLCIYANLIRDHLKNEYHPENYKSNKTDYEGYFNTARETYANVQQLSKYKDKDCFNDMAFLGEIEIYVNELKVLYELKKRKNAEERFVNEFKKKLSEYEKKCTELIDTFEQYDCDGKIYIADEHVQSDRLNDMKRRMGKALIQIQQMKCQKKIQLDRHETLGAPERLEIIRLIIQTFERREFPLMNLIKTNFKLKSFADLSKDELLLIIEYLINIHDKRLYLTYYDLVNAMIHLGQIEIRQEYNINVALQVCEEWTKKFADNFDAFYFHGLLMFALSLQENDRQRIKIATQSLATCRKLCESLIANNRNPRNYKIKEFYIGKGEGIKAIVPKSSNKDEFMDFSGRVKRFSSNAANANHGYVSEDSFTMKEINKDLLNNIEIRVSDEARRRININDESYRYFNIAFARDNLLAENIRTQEKLAQDSNESDQFD